MQHKRILIVCSFHGSLLNFRGDLITDLIRSGYEVYCAAPDFEQKTIDELHQMGGNTVNFSMEPTGLNPFKDLATIRNLKTIIQKNNIELVFAYTIKPVIYSSIAARQAKVPVVSLITGLGFTFSAVSMKSKILQMLTQRLYTFGLKKNNTVIFQNSDDLQLFKDLNVISKSQKTAVVHGSGINLERFAFRERTKSNGDIIRFVIVGRLIKEKGIDLFLDAAKILRKKYANTEFHIIGSPPENQATAISIDRLTSYQEQGVVVYHGNQNNIGPLVSQNDIFVLPTYYREGVPRSILEALSIGMPIITTNTPGCKETVENGANGILIPPQDLNTLVKAMEFFIKKPDEIDSMGQKSRMLAEKKFDVAIINKQIIDILNI
ncbi:glycosyltransferase family 4 protein [Maribacter sp. ACAM166]|uniref:glycosyltransferase family 4 protein n=1 Tax=Maribacter sp. ACAM166 TaxID=2508996 RepID=UPI0010FDD388|nr:glycosyltransferase family 4 protein [Maribacter sp. ACAM166]TLP70591.1 glycosyltransferase family 4 protein [Maribacter sp. ACAM166]